MQEILDAGGTAVADHSAVDDETGGGAMVQTAINAFGRLDALINNAGIVDDAAFTDLSLDRMRRIMDINFWGSLYPTRAAFPVMLEQGYGRIVLSCSQAGLYGQKEGSLYAASKSALIGLGRTLGREVPAVELVGDDITGCFPALDDLSNPVEAGSSFESGMVLMPELFSAEPDMTEKA